MVFVYVYIKFIIICSQPPVCVDNIFGGPGAGDAKNAFRAPGEGVRKTEETGRWIGWMGSRSCYGAGVAVSRWRGSLLSLSPA